jgi:hypothetical protein
MALNKVIHKGKKIREKENPNRYETIRRMPVFKEAHEISKRIIEVTGQDVFAQSRKRDIIEARALLTFILYKTKGMTLTQIRDFYEANGKPYDHATALHSLESFEMYRRYNKNLPKWLIEVVGNDDDIKSKKAVLLENIKSLGDEQINYLYELTEKWYQEQL